MPKYVRKYVLKIGKIRCYIHKNLQKISFFINFARTLANQVHFKVFGDQIAPSLTKKFEKKQQFFLKKGQPYIVLPKNVIFNWIEKSFWHFFIFWENPIFWCLFVILGEKSIYQWAYFFNFLHFCYRIFQKNAKICAKNSKIAQICAICFYVPKRQNMCFYVLKSRSKS